MMLANSFCSSLSGVSASSPAMPIMALSGVRISWLMVARKRPLAAAASASSRLVWDSLASHSLRSWASDRLERTRASSSLAEKGLTR